MYKTKHRKLKIEQHEPRDELRYSGRATVPAPHVTPVVLLLYDTKLICYS